MADYDAVLVGSGVNSLACGALLARVKELGTRKRGLVTDDEFRELANG